MTIQSTLIEGLNQQILQAKVNSIKVNDFQFPNHFPIKKVNAFAWRMLTNVNAGINVAADIVGDNSSTPRKKRPIFQSANGDLPKLAISREMKRSEIKDYQVALALAQNPLAVELVQYWANDVDFCFNGVQAQLEYLSWALLSNAGKLTFSSSNNAAVASEFDLDYQVDATTQKKANSTTWATADSADPIGDIAAAVISGKTIGANIKYVFISLANFYKLSSCTQIIKACSAYIANVAGNPQTPDLAAINKMLATQAWLNGVQLVIVDQYVTRELADGTQTLANPFADNVAVFSESAILGSTQYDLLQDNGNVMLRAERAHTVVKKYSHPEPLKEVTLAEADVIPVLDTAYKNIYLKTNAVAW